MPEDYLSAAAWHGPSSVTSAKTSSDNDRVLISLVSSIDAMHCRSRRLRKRSAASFQQAAAYKPTILNAMCEEEMSSSTQSRIAVKIADGMPVKGNGLIRVASGNIMTPSQTLPLGSSCTARHRPTWCHTPEAVLRVWRGHHWFTRGPPPEGSSDERRVLSRQNVCRRQLRSLW